MEALLNTVTDVLDAYGFATQHQPGDPPLVVARRTAGEEPGTVVYCHVREQQQLEVHALLPFRTPGPDQAAVRDFIGRVNAELSGVCFALHEPKGTLECRAAARIGLGKLAWLQIDALLARCLQVTDRYQDAIYRAMVPLSEPPGGFCEQWPNAVLN